MKSKKDEDRKKGVRKAFVEQMKKATTKHAECEDEDEEDEEEE